MKLTTIAILSLTAVGLGAGDALASGCCKTHCCFKQKLICSQYNAFSPPCCYPYGGCFGHKCCMPNLHIPFYPGCCGGGMQGCYGDAGGGCVGGQCQSVPSAAPMPGGPTAYAPMMPYGMMPYGMQQPMMVMQPPMGYQAPMGMPGPMGYQPPMGMGMQPPMMPAGYHPGYNGMIAPPGTMGMNGDQ